MTPARRCTTASRRFLREGGGAAWISRVVGVTRVAASLVLNDSETAPGPSLTITAAANPAARGATACARASTGSSGGLFVLVISAHRRPGNWPEARTSPTRRRRGMGGDICHPHRACDGHRRRRERPGGGPGTAFRPAAPTTAPPSPTPNGRPPWTRSPAPSAPGRFRPPARRPPPATKQLATTAAARNRIALLDGADTASTSTLIDAAAAAGASDAARFAAFLGSWVTVPGLVAGTTRTVPPSAFAAGLMARADAAGNPNQPAAGVHGIARWALAPSRTFTDDQYDALNEAGVNMARSCTARCAITATVAGNQSRGPGAAVQRRCGC